MKSGVCSLTLCIPVHMPVISKLKTLRQKEQTLEVIQELKEILLCSEGVTLSATLPTAPGCYRASTLLLCCLYCNEYESITFTTTWSRTPTCVNSISVNPCHLVFCEVISAAKKNEISIQNVSQDFCMILDISIFYQGVSNVVIFSQ